MIRLRDKKVPLGLGLIILYFAPLCLYLQTLVFVRNNNIAFAYIVLTLFLCVVTCKWNFKVDGQRAFLLILMLILLTSSIISGSLLYFFQTLILVVFLLLDIKEENIWYGLRVFRVVGLVCAIFCIFQRLFNAQYNSLIPHIFNEQNVRTILRLFNWDKSTCGLMPQTSHAAGYILIGFFVTSFDTRRKRNYLFYIELLIYILAMLFTNKRAHFLFGLISWMVTFTLGEERSKKTKRILLIALVAVVAIGVIYLILPYLNSESTIASLIYAVRNFRNSDVDVTSDRVFLSREAIEMIKSSPILGHGWGSFKAASAYKTDAHNVYLQVFAELGVFSFSIFVIVLLNSLIGSLRQLKRITRSENSDFEKYFLKISFAFQLFFVMYCMTGNCLYNIDFWSMYIFAIVLYFSSRRNLSGAGVPDQH